MKKYTVITTQKYITQIREIDRMSNNIPFISSCISDNPAYKIVAINDVPMENSSLCIVIMKRKNWFQLLFS